MGLGAAVTGVEGWVVVPSGDGGGGSPSPAHSHCCCRHHAWVEIEAIHLITIYLSI